MKPRRKRRRTSRQSAGVKIETAKTGGMKERTPGRGRYDLLNPIVLRRDALLYEKGAAKYAPRNWEKGMPVSWNIDSLLRHLMQYQMGDRSEDHLAAIRFHAGCIMYTETMVEMGRLPKNLLDLFEPPGQQE